MKSVKYIIVETDKNYNNEKEIAEGVVLVVNTTIESVEHINRVVKVHSAPDNTILKNGDEVIIHHNILRHKYDTKGKQIKSGFHLIDNLYFVPPTEVFMYRRDGGDWNALSPHCFVRPIKEEKKEKIGSIFTLTNSKEDTHKGMKKNIGVLEYPNEDLFRMNLNKGDKIIFSKDSEYEFILNGEVYYKMSTADIIGLVED